MLVTTARTKGSSTNLQFLCLYTRTYTCIVNDVDYVSWSVGEGCVGGVVK